MKTVFWLFGLPCSGKTTLAQALRDHLHAGGQPAILLDGDELRSGVCADLGFSDADRSENLRRAAYVARLLATQGNTVICAFVTPKEHHRSLVRQILGERLSLIHIDCTLEACVSRDVKGHYAMAAADHITHMTGVHEDFERPHEATPTICTDSLTIHAATEQLVTFTQLPP